MPRKSVTACTEARELSYPCCRLAGVFDGDGFGVGLTVAALDTGSLPEPGRRPARLTEVLPPEVRSRAGVALELGRVQAHEAQPAADEAALVVQLADTHPDPDTASAARR